MCLILFLFALFEFSVESFLSSGLGDGHVFVWRLSGVPEHLVLLVNNIHEKILDCDWLRKMQFR